MYIAAMNAQPRSPYRVMILVSGACYAIYAAAAVFLPPFNTLGYEFCVLSGLVVPWIAGPACMFRMRRENAGTSMAPRPDVLRSWFGSAISQLALLTIPVVIMTIAALWIPNCSMLSGMALFALIPVITVLFVTALGAFLATALPRRMAYAAYVVLVLLLLLHAVLQVLSQPQLYACNHLFGIHVGFSWDEAQPPFGTLARYRVVTLAYSALLLTAARVVAIRGRWRMQSGGFRTAALLALALSSACIGAGFFFSDQLGFSTSARYLERELGSMIVTRHFRIVYSSRSFSTGEVARVADEHEFLLDRICRELHVEWRGRITSYLYPDDATKRRLFGTESSAVTRPWAHEIHLSAAGIDATLKHELVHAVASCFGPFPLRVPLFRHYGLTEGLAMAVEWDWGTRSLHEYAAGMQALGLRPTLATALRSAGFLSLSTATSYVLCGSMCRWLIDTRGMERFKRCYATDDPETAYGVSLDALEAEYRHFLDRVPRSLPDSMAIRALFTGVPFQRKICARALTELHRDARAAFQARRYAEALRLYRQSESLHPNAAAANGIVASLYRLRELPRAIAEARRFLADNRRRAGLASLLLPMGNAAAIAGDSALADSCYSVLLRENITAWMNEGAAARRLALRSPGLRLRLMDLLDRSAEDTARTEALREWRALFAEDSAHPLVRYRLGRLLLKDATTRDEGERLLASITDRALAYDGLLEAGASRFLRNRTEARTLFERARETARSVCERRSAEEWIERTRREPAASHHERRLP
jgi:hypothetical protein